MRVAHFVQRYPPALGGSEAYFHRLGRHLADAGDSVRAFTSNAIDLEGFWSPRGRCVADGDSHEDGIDVRRYRLWRMPGRRWLLKPISLLPHRTLQCLTLPCNPIAPGMWRDAGSSDERFDIVHATSFPYAFPIACGLRLARRLGVPFLLTPFLHLGDPDDPRDPTRRGYTSPPLRALLRSADRVLVQTPGERDAVRALGVAGHRVVLQGLGVDPGECVGGDRAAARARWGIGATEVVVGHLANNSVEKGSVDLLRAAKSLWDGGAAFRVVLAGPEMPNFRAFLATFSEASRVVRFGVLTDAEKRDFFAGIDAFALPSRSDSFGLVLLEAWANGVPNIAYRAGGIADLIRHGRDGFLAKCGDLDELTALLGRLIADAGLRRSFGDAGRARVGREFRWADKLELVRDTMSAAIRVESEPEASAKWQLRPR